MAVYIYANQIDPLNARLTPDVDICIRRRDLDKILPFVDRHRFQLVVRSGIDTLLDRDEPKTRRAVHLIYSGEKVRADYLAPVPEIETPELIDGFRIAPISQLLVMKLTSNKLKDQAHIRDLLNVDLITPEMEAAIPDFLRERYEYIKAHE
jgi:hypothetical protein